jgi:hypothetical protein
MSINSHLSTCVGTQSPKYLEMAQGHISLSDPRVFCKVHICEHVVLRGSVAVTTCGPALFVAIGMFLVESHSTVVLFDTRAMHSFITATWGRDT